MRIMNIGTAIIVSFIFIMFTSMATASDEKNKAQKWTPGSLSKALSAMPKGDIARGKELNQSMMCASCHGDEGIAPTANWPNVAGQKADYTYKTLLDYKSALRAEDNRSRLMLALSPMMSKQDMADIAEYYASLSAASNVDGEKAENAIAEQLVRKGDKSRLMTPCASCHGLHGQGGKEASPALAGLSRDVFIRTMQMYKTGKRHNDVNEVMSQFARKLTDTEIEHLADYYKKL